MVAHNTFPVKSNFGPMNNWKCPPNDVRLPKNSLLYRPTGSTLTFIHVNKTTVNICQQKPSHIGHVGAPKHHSLSLSFPFVFLFAGRQCLQAESCFKIWAPVWIQVLLGTVRKIIQLMVSFNLSLDESCVLNKPKIPFRKFTSHRCGKHRHV